MPCAVPSLLHSYITLTLNASYDDIGGVGVWPMTDSLSNLAQGQNLTIYLHSQPNFATDPNTVVCVRSLKTNTYWESYVHCNATSAVQYGELDAGSISIYGCNARRHCQPVAVVQGKPTNPRMLLYVDCA